MSIRSLGNITALLGSNDVGNLTDHDAANQPPLLPAEAPDDSTLTADADARRESQRLDAALARHNFQSRFTASLPAPPDAARLPVQSDAPSARETFQVPVPKSHDPQAIRDYILKNELGFTDADIKEFDTATDGKGFYITVDDKTTESGSRLATPKDVAGFPTAKGRTPINVDGELIERLRAFRDARQATIGITDETLRRNVTDNLTAALPAKDGGERVQAAINLSGLATGNAPEAAKIANVLRTAADSNRDNAGLQIAAARASAVSEQARYDATPHPKLSADFTDARQHTATALQAAAKSGNRAEAALVNKYAAQIFGTTGDKPEAQWREMLGRFYEVDDNERGKFANLGNLALPTATIPRWKEASDGTPSMRATTPEESALRRFAKENPAPPAPQKEIAEDPQKREWRVDYLRNEKGEKVLGKDGKPIEIPQQRFLQEGSIREQNTIYEREIHFNKNGKEVRRDLPYDYKLSSTEKTKDEGAVLNPTGTTKAFVAAGGVGLIEEFNKWGSFLGDLYNGTTAKKIAEGDKLEKAVTNATTYAVPPRPEDLPRERQRLVQSLGTGKEATERVNAIMHRLEEMSRAFWNK